MLFLNEEEICMKLENEKKVPISKCTYVLGRYLKFFLLKKKKNIRGSPFTN